MDRRVIGSFIGVLIGYGIYAYWDYKTHPDLYAMQSAPWYLRIWLSGIVTAAILLLVLVIKLILWKKLKKKGRPLSELTLEELWELFPIVLSKPQSCWKEWYEEEKLALSALLIDKNFTIHHIGSTAIHGIWAKPIVDILLEIPAGSSMEEIKEILVGGGYLCMSEEENKKSFNKGYTAWGFAERVFHLHLRYEGDHDELYFRDYMNRHPEAAAEYEKLKLSLWKKYEHNRDAYTDAKGEFVKKYTSLGKNDPMKNPWEEIPLTDYENHMKLDSVMQLQAMNEMMKGQFDAYPVSSVMILGVAGGNGLERVRKGQFEKVYGVDVNASYLKEVIRRYPNLAGVLECLCVNLIDEPDKLPRAELVIANLLIEYIGYACFQKVIRCAGPKYVSCIIQINVEEQWVSDSPYLHVFDGLKQVHHQMEGRALEQAMSEIGYQAVKTLEHMLPNGKKLVQIDFERG